jgi:Ammonium Transporter Family
VFCRDVSFTQSLASLNAVLVIGTCCVIEYEKPYSSNAVPSTFLCAAALVTAGWVVAMMVPLFATLKYTGLLRVTEHAEDIGLDRGVHGGPCYAEVSETSPLPALQPGRQATKVFPSPACATDLTPANMEVTVCTPAVDG